MLTQAIPRLVIRLRSTFPDARVELASGRTQNEPHTLSVYFPNRPDWKVICRGVEMPNQDRQFQFFESSLLLQLPHLQNLSDEDFCRFVSSENLGLRGVTVLPGSIPTDKSRKLLLRAGFVGQKGRTRDEAENLAIDVLSLLRFARLLEDRVLRSSVGVTFSFEMYHSQFLSVSRGRNRYINYARSVFQGSVDRVFGQITAMLKNDFRSDVENTAVSTAKITLSQTPGSNRKTEFVLRVPEEVPMVTCHSPLMTHRGSNKNQGMKVLPLLTMQKIAMRLNRRAEMATEPGHFEVNPDGSFISYVSWKHLTNDIRLYSLDHIITAVTRAEKMLNEEIHLEEAGRSTRSSSHVFDDAA